MQVKPVLESVKREKGKGKKERKNGDRKTEKDLGEGTGL